MRKTVLLLIMCAIMSYSVISVCSAETRIERSLARGATYIEIHRNSAGCAPLAVYVLKLDRTAKNLSFRAMKGNDHVVGTASARTMGESLSDKKGEVLATINADFFDMEKPLAGLPCGMIVRDGELLCSPDDWPTLSLGGFDMPKFGMVKLQGDIQAGTQTYPVSVVNRPRPGSNDLAVFTAGFGPSTLNNKPGTDVVVEDIVPQLPLKAGVRYSGRVSQTRKGVTDDPIPAGAVLLSGSGLAASFLEKNATAGSAISFSLGFGAEWNQVTEALGAWPILIHEGRLQTMSPDDISTPRYPRSAVGWNDHDLYFVAIDGRDSLDSLGMSMPELQVFMQELGCTEAVNLDGGGSTMLAIRGNVVNHPSDGLDRLVSSGWAVINSAPIGALKSVQVLPENLSILAGSHVQFRVTGSDAEGKPVQVNPRDVKWSLGGIEASSSSADPDSAKSIDARLRTNSELGTVDASGMFTAARVFREGLVTARVGDSLSVSVVNVWDKPAALFIIPSDAVQQSGRVVHCSVLANDRSGRPMVLDASQVVWKAEGANITSGGTLTVPSSGQFKVTAQVAGVCAYAEFRVLDK